MIKIKLQLLKIFIKGFWILLVILIKLIKITVLLNQIRNSSLKLLCRLLNDPDYEEACYLGNFKHIDGCKKAYQYIANPFPNFFSVFNQEKLFEDYKINNWKPAFKKRIREHKFYSKFINADLFQNILSSKFIQKRLNRFINKYKNSKICCYGAGLIAKELVNSNKLADLNIISFIRCRFE